jgi:hypothetical protein
MSAADVLGSFCTVICTALLLWLGWLEWKEG